MKRLKHIPEPEFTRHDEVGTLGDSDEVTEEVLRIFDNQLHAFGLGLVVFDNGSALNWFIEHLAEHNTYEI